MFTRPDNWNELTPLERRKLRLDHWQNQPVEFVSPEAEAKYKERIGLMRKAYDNEVAERFIAEAGNFGEYAFRRKGVKGRAVVYDHDDVRQPILEFLEEFDPDTSVGGLPYPGKSWDMLDFKLYQWGGNQLPDDLVIQAVEGEYMKPEEYKDFIKDPTSFWLKKYLPRAYGALEPLSMLPEFTMISESVDTIPLLIPFANPQFREMLQKLMDASDELMKVLGSVGQTGAMVKAQGYPIMGTNIVKVPFDYLGDTLRGTKGILTDMFRRPNDVLEAVERYVPILSEAFVAACDRNGAPQVTYVLHKGADSFMSQEQFEKFYWPAWKQVMLALYEEGIICRLFIEGSYNDRLENLAEMPDKSLVCHFDQTDMKRAKEVLGDKFTIAGNVPASLMSIGTPDQVREYCDGLVELFDGSPGYIMTFGCGFENTTPENTRAYINSVRK